LEDTVLVYALDIGGSSVKHGVIKVTSTEATPVGHSASVTLPSVDFADLKNVVFDVIGKIVKDEHSIRAVGISTTGSVDRDGLVVSAGHFNGYKNVSWADLIRPAFSQIDDVVTVNDGRASAWAEYSADSSIGRSHIHVVVGTGVGGGIVHNGELMLGDSGQAGYIGHIKITTNPTPKCSCGSQGCVEVLSSGPAIVRYFNEYLGVSTEERTSALDDVTAAAVSGDGAAVRAFETAGHWLGIGLGNAMNVLNPSVVSVGGGVLLASASIRGHGEGGPFLSAVSDGILVAAHRRVAASGNLRLARFGNDGGMIGAARLAMLAKEKGGTL
jgi:glucokinase